jgi:hypothetical protein
MSPFILNLGTIDSWQNSIAPDHYHWRTSHRYRTLVILREPNGRSECFAGVKKFDFPAEIRKKH